MDNNSSTKNRRLVFIISGITDAIIGAALLLLGFGVFSIDVTEYGFQNWHAIALGGVMFVLGVGTLAYNLSRMEE